jgi:hypothetical protein
MSDHITEPSRGIDLSEPRGPMTLKDWAALYPTVPERTISLCIWEASQNGRSHDSHEDRNAVIAWLVCERLEELRSSLVGM